MKAIRAVESAMTAGPCLPGSAPSLGGPAKGGRGIVSGALGAAFLAAALAFPAGEAWAQTPTDTRNQCGALDSSGAATCSNQAYGTGIQYDMTDGWVNGIVGPVTLTVTGGSATTVSSASATGWGSGIVVRAAEQADSTSRTIALTVGSGNNAVAITQTSGTLTGGFDNTGVVIHQRGAAADATTVTLGSGVTIGTETTAMTRSGVHVLVDNGANTATQKIDSAATIYSTEFGLIMDSRGAGNVEVMNRGSITTTTTGGNASNKSGIRILDWTHSPGRDNSFGGDSRTADTTTTVTNSGSVMVSAAAARGIHITADGLGLYKTVNSGTVSASGGSHGILVEARYHTGAAGSEAVEVENMGAITAAGVTIAGGVTTDVGGHGIYVETIANDAPAGRGIGNVKIANSGSVTARQAGIHVNANMGDISVTHSGAGTVSSSILDGIQIQRRGAGEVTVTSSADIAAGRHGIFVTAVDTPAAATTVSAGLTTKPFSTTTVIAAGMTSYTHDWSTATTVAAGTTITTYATPDDISVTTTGGAITAEDSGIRVEQRGADATVASSADITAKKYGIFVTNDPALATVAIAAGVTTRTWSNTGAVSVTHSAGDIDAETESGIHAQNSAGNADEVKIDVTGGSVSTDGQSKAAVAVLQRGTGDAVASVSSGAMLTSKHNAGVYANLEHAANAAGQVKVTQGGTIAGRKGVYARAGRASAAGETRAVGTGEMRMVKQPLIDVTWTGAFSHGTTVTVAQTDDDRFLPTSVAHAVAVAQEVEAEKAMRPDLENPGSGGHLRYGSPAGIEAQVLSWREVMTAVAKGDDPGAFADAAAVTALFDENADAATKARAAAVIAAFKAVLANEDLDTIPGAAAIDTDGTTGLSDDEIETYLSVDDAARRTLLRNVLAQGFTDAEKAVLRAAATNDGLTDAVLDAALPAGATPEQKTAYRTAVRNLLKRFNVGDIRIAVGNTSVAGSIVASRGDGIRAYYATPNDKNGAIDVTIAAGTTVTGGMAGIYVANAGMGTDDVLKQSVTVDGRVRGGTDAAVHLVGGGRLTVGAMGEVLAGSSGIGVLVNEPGPAHLTINGKVFGGNGGAAAVHLTGGGGLTVGATGRVEANGATSAIRTDGSRTDLVIEGEVKGSAEGEAAVHLAGGGTVTIRAPTRSGAAPRVDANGAMWAIQGNGVRVDITTTGNVQDPGVRKSAADAAVKGSVGPDVRAAVVQLNDAGDPTGHSQGLPLTPEGEFDPSSFTPVTPTTVTASVTVMASVTTMTEPTTVTARVPVPSPTQPTQTQPLFECERASDRRCELYEALPSVLLTMNGMLSYAERSSAARDANGGWARVEGARGKWEAKKASSTTGRLSYDHRRGGVRAGVDLGAGEHGRVGVSAHLLNGKAERAGVGDVEVDGMGAGASATWRWGEWYADAQAGATWYEVGVDHRESGVLVKEADGLGYAMEVEAGRGMALGEEGLVVTPRVGLAWSKVEMSDFTFTSKVGTQETVSVEDAHSARGRLGVLVEAEVGMGERSGRLFGSLDVEQEFSDETRVDVGATKLSENELKTEVRSTTVRLGVGGVLGLGEDLVLRGTAGYETSGSGTSGYGGGLEVNLRF